MSLPGITLDHGASIYFKFAASGSATVCIDNIGLIGGRGGDDHADYNYNGILDGWEIDKFGNADPGANPADADPDGDGLSNLMEFALDTDPLVPNKSTAIADFAEVDGDKYLRLSVARNPAATNLIYEIQTSGDLVLWSAEDTVIEVDSAEWLVARHEVFAGLYAELRRIARSKMAGERQGGTLDTSGLVHKAWLRLEKSSPEQWRDRKQFYAAASEAMRRILVEAARRRLAAKRGGGEGAVPLHDALPVAAPMDDDRLIEVHEVLDRLEAEYPMDARIVKLRFFSGLGNEEIAALLEVSERTVERHWKLAKLWLYRELRESNGESR